LDNNDWENYLVELEKMTLKYKNVQIIFSSSEQHKVQKSLGVTWTPNYPGEKHPMYLGVKGTELKD
jgi:hypothetical protein